MPDIRKQTTRMGTTANQTNQGVLSRIKSVSQRAGGLKLTVYGETKTGKTRFACTFPKPLLLIGTEDGTDSVCDVEGVDFIRLHHTDEMTELVQLLKEGKYKTVALDTAGKLQDMILKEIKGWDEMPLSRNWGMAEQQDWGACTAQLKERIAPLFNLSNSTPLHTVIIAHERAFGGRDEGTVSEVIAPKVGAALTPSAAAWLHTETSYLCQCFKREKVEAKKTTIAGQEATTYHKTGKIEYCLRTGEHTLYLTGFRMPTKSGALPDCIVNPTFEKVMALIKGATKTT